MVALLSGCQTFYSVSRSATASDLPTIAEIQKVISKIPEITSVELTVTERPTSFSLYEGIQKRTDIHQFLIRSKTAFVVLAINQEAGKEILFYANWRYQKPTKEEEDQVNALIDIIYRELAEAFPSLPSSSDFTIASVHPVGIVNDEAAPHRD